MSSLVKTFMGVSVPSVGEIVVLHWWVVGVGMIPAGSAVGRQKCFCMGQVTDVNVCPSATLWLPWVIQRKQDGGQS